MADWVLKLACFAAVNVVISSIYEATFVPFSGEA